jgi:hypothetical protein
VITPEDVKFLTWKPRVTWRIPRQISDEERQQREEELIQYRQREREAWEEEKRRLGL